MWICRKWVPEPLPFVRKPPRIETVVALLVARFIKPRVRDFARIVLRGGDTSNPRQGEVYLTGSPQSPVMYFSLAGLRGAWDDARDLQRDRALLKAVLAAGYEALCHQPFDQIRCAENLVDDLRRQLQRPREEDRRGPLRPPVATMEPLIAKIRLSWSRGAWAGLGETQQICEFPIAVRKFTPVFPVREGCFPRPARKVPWLR